MVATWLAASGLGAGDCEIIRSGLLAQPGNALSSVAYVAAGAALVVMRGRMPRTRRLSVAGRLIIAVGVGSFLYHGWAPAAARFVHDVTIGGLLGFLGWWSAPDVSLRRVWLPAAGVTVATLALFPAISGFVLALVGSIATGAVAIRLGRVPELRPRLAVLALVAAAAGVTFVLGSTDGAWCLPDSMFQAHAAWHTLSAAALALTAALLAEASVRDQSERISAHVTR